jgi:dipeptide transport system permease protein
MLLTIIRKITHLLVSFFILTIFTFSLAQLFPNGSSFIFDPDVDSAILLNAKLEMTTYTSSIFESYIVYMTQILQGNFGFSTVRGTSVFKEFFIYFPATLELALSSLFFALLLGLPLGIFAARKKNKWQDKLIVSTTLVGYSMPIFWWAMLLVLLFSLWLGITPVASRIGFEFDIQPVTGFMLIDTLLSKQSYALEAFYSALHHLILPTVVLGTIPLAVITRTTRSAMISVLAEDYIRSAKARGILWSTIIWKHALRNAMIPIFTVMGLQISILLTGSLLTETIFSWPGAGKWLLDAVYRRDFPVVHGGILAIASFVIIVHLLLDVLKMLVDPKLRRY